MDIMEVEVDRPDTPFHALRGNRVYRNTGELSFETRPREAGTYPVIFLEWVPNPSWDERELELLMGAQGDNTESAWAAKIINERGRVQVVHHTLVSPFNI